MFHSCLVLMTLILKQEVSISQMKEVLKILTLTALTAFYSVAIFAEGASGFYQEKMDLNLRWNFYAPKDNLLFENKGDSLLIKSLNSDIFSDFVEGIKTINKKNKYIKDVLVHKNKDYGLITSIEIKLAGPEVETFSFYRDREKKYILDFWIDEATLEAKKSLNIMKVPASIQAPEPKAKIVSTPKPVKKINKKKVVKKEEPKVVKAKLKEKDYRDFRYGASFVWDYPPLMPALDKIIDVQSKTPEFFYPIENRNINTGDKQKDAREAHLQLSINLYRNKKYGLMYKSINLYYQKYGESADFEVNEYLKANAILRTQLSPAGKEPLKMAIAMLDKLAGRTTNYELSKGILKYLMSISIEKGEWVDVLKNAKKLYVTSKKNFDYETSGYVGEIIFHCLSYVGQIERIDELKRDKTIKKLVPTQKIMAYEMYSYLVLNNAEEAVKRYEEIKEGFSGDILPSVLYNTAEAYFQTGNYKKAIKLFDEFIAKFSYHINSQQARLRLALAFDLINSPEDQVQALYKEAIDRSNQFEVSYEARIRYVAFRNLRKLKFNEDDKLIRSFLSNEKNIKLNKELKKLLWITKLRLLIVDEKFEEALAYLNAIPLELMTAREKRVFEADGAEVIYGVLLENFNKRDFTRIIKVWEIYKDIYIDKVAGDPFINFIVGKSFVEMGLFDGFARSFEKFKRLKGAPERTYPLWVNRPKHINYENLLVELNLNKDIKQGDFVSLKSNIKKLKSIDSKSNRVNYYDALLAYSNKNYAKSIALFEEYLSKKDQTNIEDGHELADILRKYTDSLYYKGELDRYKKVGEAILDDLNKVGKNNFYLREVKEKISYTMIEILAGEKKQASFLMILPKVKEFAEKYPDSQYLQRLEYLKGLAYVETKQMDKGKEIFNKILSMEKAPTHLKDLVKSELTLIKIKEQTL